MGAAQKIVFAAEASQLSLARESVRHFLKESVFAPEEKARIVMAVDEACSNIIRHAECGSQKPVRLEMKWLRDRARFILRDYGKPFDAAKLEPRDPQIIRPGGYGVFIIHEVFDVVTYAPQARGTRLTMEKLLPLGRTQSCF